MNILWATEIEGDLTFRVAVSHLSTLTTYWGWIGFRPGPLLAKSSRTKMVDALATSDSIFSCDGRHAHDLGRPFLKMNGKRRLLGSFNHGSMANALPQAIGAQLSHHNHTSNGLWFRGV